MEVSIIIPAFNGANTLGTALQSVVEQTFQNWEVIIVNDGSTDDTITVAQQFIQQDGRIRLINQSNRGACAARNAGLAAARYNWLLFLDADDWLLPPCLEQMTKMLAANLELDAVHVGWNRVAVDGTVLEGELFYASGDLFHIWAQWPLFPPHACLVRRSISTAVGGWDESFHTCQEWDFWQRFCRTGAQFGVIPEVLVHYRMRPGSISTSDPLQLLRDGLRCIENGHAPDPRVPNPHPAHKEGSVSPNLDGLKLLATCWPAGLALSLGMDARFLLDEVGHLQNIELFPSDVAEAMFRAVPFGSGLALQQWQTLWPDVSSRLSAFLQALEVQAAPGLAEQASALLEDKILDVLREQRPLTIGHTHAIMVEVTQPIPEVTLPAGTKRLHCTCLLEREQLGSVILDAHAEPIDAATIAEAIAAEFAWLILGRYFEHTLYPHLKVKRQNDRLSIWRGNICLAHDLPTATADFWSSAHDQIGWELFLQEIWARPRWSQSTIYNGQAAKEYMPTRRLSGKKLVVEVSQPLLNVVTDENEIEIIIMVGGTELGRMQMNVSNGRITAHELRAAITTYAGLDLCRLAVCEGLIGYNLSQLPSLRVQLARLARQQIERTDFSYPTILNRLAYSLEWLWQRIDGP